jgi:hypothetical protein
MTLAYINSNTLKQYTGLLPPPPPQHYLRFRKVRFLNLAYGLQLHMFRRIPGHSQTAPCSCVCIAQLPKNFPTFYWAPGFVTVFTRALHSSLSWIWLINFTQLHLISLISSLTLSFHLRLCLRSSLFLYGIPTKTSIHSASTLCLL